MKSNAALQVIANAAKVPEYAPAAVKALMKRLDMNERAFALVMNVAPITVRLWTTGAAKPSSTARRLMQLFDICPDLVNQVIQAEKGGMPCKKKLPKG